MGILEAAMYIAIGAAFSKFWIMVWEFIKTTVSKWFGGNGPDIPSQPQ